MIIISIVSYCFYLLTLLINVILFSIKVTKTSSVQLKIIRLYLWIMFIVQVLSEVMTYVASDNLSLLHVYLISHLIILTMFYHSMFNKVYQKRFLYTASAIACLFLVIQYWVHPVLWFQFNLSEIFIVNYLLTVYSLIYNYNSLSEKHHQFHYFNFGIMGYSILSTASFLYGNIATKMELSISIPVWTIHIIVLIFFQCMMLLQWSKHFYIKKRYEQSF